MIETQLLSGTVVSAAVKEEVGQRVEALKERGKSVGLATVLVGEDPASEVYVRNKRRTAEKLGKGLPDRFPGWRFFVGCLGSEGKVVLQAGADPHVQG